MVVKASNEPNTDKHDRVMARRRYRLKTKPLVLWAWFLGNLKNNCQECARPCLSTLSIGVSNTKE